MSHLSCFQTLVILLFLAVSPLYGADLFGGGSDDGPSLGQQKEAYDQIFAKVDAEAADSRRQRLPFARKLTEHLRDSDFSGMHDYMCLRIKQLLEKERSVEAQQILLRVFDFEYRDQAPDYAACDELQELLYVLLKKSPKEEQKRYLQRLIDLHTYVVRRSCFEDDMDRAYDHVRALDKLYRAVGDHAAREEIRIYYRAIKGRRGDVPDIAELQQAASNDAQALRAFALYALHLQRPDAALEQLDQDHELRPLLHCQQLLLNGDAVPGEEAGRSIFIIHELLKDDDIDFFFETQLLNLGLALRAVIDASAGALDNQLVLRCKMATDDWEERMSERPLLRRRIGGSDSGWIQGGAVGGLVLKGLGPDDVVELHIMLQLARFLNHSIDPGGEGPQLRILDPEDTRLWNAQVPRIPFDPQSAAVVIDLCHSTISAHPLDQMETSLDLLMNQFKAYRGQVVFRSLLLKSEVAMQIDENGERFKRQQEFHQRLLAYAEEHGIPVIDCYTPSLKAWQRDKQTVFHQDIYAIKMTPAGIQLASDIMSEALGLSLKQP